MLFQWKMATKLHAVHCTREDERERSLEALLPMSLRPLVVARTLQPPPRARGRAAAAAAACGILNCAHMFSVHASQGISSAR